GPAPGAAAVPRRRRIHPQAVGRVADRRLRLEGPSPRRRRRVRPPCPGAGQPRRGQRRRAAGTGAPHRRVGARALRRFPGTGTKDRRGPLVSRSAPVQAALLMLTSTLLFALMVLAIRLASQQLHAFEVAFFRSFFGMLAALPLLR